MSSLQQNFFLWECSVICRLFCNMKSPRLLFVQLTLFSHRRRYDETGVTSAHVQHDKIPSRGGKYAAVMKALALFLQQNYTKLQNKIYPRYFFWNVHKLILSWKKCASCAQSTLRCSCFADNNISVMRVFV